MVIQANPIIPWLGGKRRLADKLIPLFPKHECYVEVFCGGAALYFLRPFPAATEVINDINGDLVNLYPPLARSNSPTFGQVKFPQAGQSGL